MTITDFLVMNAQGEELKADAFGNNLAFDCLQCGHPVLAIAVKNQRGSDEEHPAECKGCGKRHFLDLRESAQKLYVHTLPSEA